jgi:hypothetical protein
MAVMPKVSVLHRASDTLAASYTLYPLLYKDSVRRVDFFADPAALQADRNRHLLIVGWLQGAKSPSAEDIQWLERLRNKYAVVAYLDCNDGTEIQRAAFMRYFDLWFVKQAFRDRRAYMIDYPGQRFYTPFYIDRYGVSDGDQAQNWSTAVREQDIGKIRVCWNILIGAYPLRPASAKCASFMLNAGLPRLAGRVVYPPPFRKQPSPTLPKCHARFDHRVYRPSVGYQRTLFRETIRNSPEFLVGPVSRRQYNRELRQVQAVLSPFGWGEVCFRDAEAVVSGAVLVKPAMDHVDTWPDIYQPNETYVPVMWDASDVVPKTQSVLGNAPDRQRLSTNAWQALQAAYRRISKRAELLLDTVLAGQ